MAFLLRLSGRVWDIVWRGHAFHAGSHWIDNVKANESTSKQSTTSFTSKFGKLTISAKKRKIESEVEPEADFSAKEGKASSESILPVRKAADPPA